MEVPSSQHHPGFQAKINPALVTGWIQDSLTPLQLLLYLL